MNSLAPSPSDRRQPSQVGRSWLRLLIAATAGLVATTGHVNLMEQTLSWNSPAVAAEKGRIRWTPKKERGNVKGTLSGGRRGQEASTCSPDAQATRLNLLVPQERASLVTTSEHPTFSWQLQTQQPTQVQFILSDMSNPMPIYTQSLETSMTQLMSVTLPDSVGLSEQTRYRWTVVVDCPDGQKTEIYARSFIRRVSGESLEQQLNQKPPIAQATVFAEHGIWYDAVGRLLQANSEGQETAQAALTTLLRQGVPDGSPLPVDVDQ